MYLQLIQSFLLIDQLFMFSNITNPSILEPYITFEHYALGKQALFTFNVTCADLHPNNIILRIKSITSPFGIKCDNLPPLSRFPLNTTVNCKFIMKDSDKYEVFLHNCNKGIINATLST